MTCNCNDHDKAVQVRMAMEKELLNLRGVVGVSHCNPEGKIILYVEDRAWAEAVPSILAGVPVEVKVVGKVRILPFVATHGSVIPNRLKHRPILGGISISYPDRIAGTLGVVTYDGKILTNAHVIAINFRECKWNPKGTKIIQPGGLDGGDYETDVVGYLDDFVHLHTEGNLVDVAVGKPTVEYKAGEVLGLGKIKGWSDPVKEMEVLKSGRTTGITKGKITDTLATIKVYGYLNLPKDYAIFEDVVVIEPPMAMAGDSGSALLTKDNKITGLVFAGSEFITVACKIRHVIEALKVNLGPYYKPPKVEEPEKPKIKYEPVSLLMSLLPIAMVDGAIYKEEMRW